MKIAFFTDTYWPQINGVTESIDTLKRELENLGHEVYVVAPKSPGYKDEDPNVFRLSSVKFVKDPEQRMIIPIPEKDLRKLFRHKFDLVHIHTLGTAGFLGWEIAQLRDLPCVLTYHTLLNRYTHYFLKGKIIRPKVVETGSKIFCNLCDLIIAPTNRVRDELKSYGVRKKILVIPGGIELDRFKKLKEGFLREKLDLNKEAKIILYLGRLGKEKNLGFVVKALKNLLKNEKETHLVIVGDGPERKNLEKLAKELGLESKVLFTGFIHREKVPNIYADSDVFVFASDSETQGLTVPEAMAAGLPVVVVKDPAFEDVVTDGKTGIVTERNEVNFAENVQRLLQDKNLKERLGKNAKEFVSEAFSSQDQAKKLVSSYEEANQINAKKRKVRRILKSRINVVREFLGVNVAFTRFKEAMKEWGKYGPS